MERIGFSLKVKKDKLEEYKKHHAAVWPELLDAIRKHGMRNYSIFTTDDGQLFGYAECDVSLEASLAGLDSEEINVKWQNFMKPFFEDLSGRPDESLIKLEQIFYTD